MEEQNHNGVGSSCPVCGAPIAPGEMNSHSCDEGGIKGNGENHENVPPPLEGGEDVGMPPAPLPPMEEGGAAPFEDKGPEIPPSQSA